LADQSAKSSIDDHAKVVSLEVPIVIDGSHIKRTIVFRLAFTNTGYGVEFVKIFQNINTGQISEIVGDYINPPVTQVKIQNVLRKFLRDRKIGRKANTLYEIN
jgi:dTDP-4-dehydrorhamnose reductase